jgi:hypothetical protein
MKVLFDTDVVLDLLLDRHPHSAFAGKLLSRVEVWEILGFRRRGDARCGSSDQCPGHRHAESPRLQALRDSRVFTG